MPSQELSYIGGMDKDTAYSMYQPSRYYHLSNGKIVTVGGSSTGAVEVEKGNRFLFELPTTVNATYKIVAPRPTLYPTSPVTVALNGHAATFTGLSSMNELADAINADPLFHTVAYKGYDYFILTDVIGVPIVTGCGAILNTPLQSNLNIIGVTNIRDEIIVFSTSETSDTPNSYGQIWKLSLDEITETITGLLPGGYLSSSTHLIYTGKLDFSTHYPITEFATNKESNVFGKVYFTDGYNILRQFNAYDPDLMAATPESFAIVADVDLTQPRFIKMHAGGYHKSGIIQYAYRLYNKYGTISRFSPPSELIYLTDKNEAEQYTCYYYGAPADTDVNKTVEIQLNINDMSYDSIQVISIFYKTMTGTPVIKIVSDEANNQYVKSVFDGNREGLEEIDYFTYLNMGGRLFSCQTLATKDNLLLAANLKDVKFDLEFDARAYRFDTVGASYMSFDMTDPVNWGISKEADCVNPYNSYDNYRAGTADYKYQADGITLGGTGPNVSYHFELVNNITESHMHDRAMYTTSKIPLTIGGVTYNSSSYGFDCQASPYTGFIRSWTRGEVYRCGLVFFDNYSRASFVKWIGDIRMPSASESLPSTFDGVGLNTLGHLLFPVFTITNPPLDAEGNPYRYSIVSVPRTGQDSTVLCNGLLDTVFENIHDSQYLNPTVDYANVLEDTAPHTKIFRVQSPEVNFNKNINPVLGDIIEIHGTAAGKTTDGLALGADMEMVVKYTDLDVLALPNSPDRFLDIEEGEIMGVAYGVTKTFATGEIYRNYLLDADLGGSRYSTYQGTTMIIRTENDLNPALFAVAGWHPYISYIRPSLTQYGGNTFADRSRNEYLQASEIQDTYNVPVFALYGDSFIGMYDYLDKQWDETVATLKIQQILYFPTESTINMAYRHDICYSRIGAPALIPASGAYRLCETIAEGVAMHGANYYPQATDLYLYNTVYSRKMDGIKYYPSPFNFDNSVEYDTEIAVCEPRLVNQSLDNWSIFLPNNSIFVEGEYGSVNKIIKFNNQIHFLQDSAIGIVAVNERVTTVDQTGATLVLGTGDRLGRFAYISTATGTMHKASVVIGGNGLNFMDVKGSKWMVFNGQSPSPVSDVKGLSGFLNDALLHFKTKDTSILDTVPYGVLGVNDNRNNRVIMTVVTHHVNGLIRTRASFTLTFNYLLNAFESFLDSVPRIYHAAGNNIIATNPTLKSQAWLQDHGAYGSFFGTIYPTVLEVISAVDSKVTKIATNLQYDSHATQNNVDVHDSTFESLRVTNSYQDSGEVPIVDDVNARRLMRTWRVWLPRDNDENSLTYNPANDSDARIRDRYNKIRLVYNNQNNYRFIAYNMQVDFIANQY